MRFRVVAIICCALSSFDSDCLPITNDEYYMVQRDGGDVVNLLIKNIASLCDRVYEVTQKESAINFYNDCCNCLAVLDMKIYSSICYRICDEKDENEAKSLLAYVKNMTKNAEKLRNIFVDLSKGNCSNCDFYSDDFGNRYADVTCSIKELISAINANYHLVDRILTHTSELCEDSDDGQYDLTPWERITKAEKRSYKRFKRNRRRK